VGTRKQFFYYKEEIPTIGASRVFLNFEMYKKDVNLSA